jgi:tetratricopeptide (TPR) repeat protein
MKALTPGLQLGPRFALVRRVAEGGSSQVWLAEDRELGRRVALKIMDARIMATPVARIRVEKEIELAGSLPAGCAVEILGLHEVDGLLVLEMEYLSGGDLGQFRGRSFAVFAKPLLEVARALGIAHERGLVHGDLKCANVLLDAGGSARLGDFGLAALAGSVPGGGSPYNMSPQRLRGEPASTADDLYAFGAMLYELLSGQPPYYPRITRERILHEPAPPLVPRAPAPERARQLALQLLSKSPAARPSSMTEVAEELARALAEPDDEAIAPRSAAPAIVAPADTPPTREDRSPWPRGAALAAAGLLVLGLAYVFLWLPGQVEQRAAATGEEARAAATVEAGRMQRVRQDDAAMAEASSAAGQARAAYETRRLAIEAQAAAIWSTEALVAARALGDGAAERFALQQYAEARAGWEKGLAALDAIEASRPAALAAALAAGDAALSQGQSESASRAFQLALAIDPGNAPATRGLARAGTLDEVFALLDQALRDEKSGRITEARDGYRKALALDPAVPAARAALERIDARQANEAYAAAMSRGLAAMAAGRLQEARSAFGQARSIRPGSREVADALAQLERGQRAEGLQGLTETALAAEQAERWEDARLAWSEALAIEPTLAPAREGLDRAVLRAQLDAQLDGLLSSPVRLTTETGRATARSTLVSVGEALPPKQLLAGKAQRLAAMIEAAETPVSLLLISDGFTEVVIYRVGRMGAFQSRQVKLLPGRYAVVGTRAGYRDVRKEVEIPFGSLPNPVIVRCEEPI